MQYEITDTAAFTFSSAFYERIAEGSPVDKAMTLAREEVKMTLGSLEWATPVLILASDQTRIFSLRNSETTPIPRPPAKRLAEVGPCSHVALGPSNLLATACVDGVVRIFDGTDGRPVCQCMPVQREEPVRVAWSPWRRHVASRHRDGTVIVWDLQTRAPVLVIGAGGQDDSLAFSADGRWLALTAGDHVHVYDVRGARVRDLPVWSRKEVCRPGQPRTLGPIVFAPGDRHVVVACGDGLVRQLNVQGKVVTRWPHPLPVSSLAVTADRLATGCLDGRVRLWSWEGRPLQHTDPGRHAAHLALSADLPLLAMADDEGNVVIRDLVGWNATTATRLTSPPAGLAFLDSRGGLVTGTRAGVVERWSLPEWTAAEGSAS
ncbi:hypothetical protein AQI88_15685 [Streptomyces cellostaticus]|uniref:Uncharacterized protein n=2 Tax=Streptomyces cellostaticus TaxID=67285 RepID=A0A117PWN1_9ACTN|nr:hypothetical protein AQI88_15685 [Streptomyces cellostaticus]